MSRRQFMDWVQFNAVKPLDGDRKRDELMAMAVLYLARAAGNTELEYDQLNPDRFDEPEGKAVAGLDPAILQAFAASG